jgi:chorismate mutase-like protein
MKNVETCETLTDIRDCIDQIDASIIEQIALRSTYVKAAAKFKRTVDEVKAADRVAAMIASRRSWAVTAGIEPDFIEVLFRRIVAFFVMSEQIKWENENAPAAGPVIEDATIADAQSILALQKRAFIQEAEAAGNDYNIPPIVETIAEMHEDVRRYSILKATLDGRIVGSVRARMIGVTCHIGRVIVEPIYQGKGYGSVLMQAIEARFSDAKFFELFTGEASSSNIRFYSNRGYTLIEPFSGPNALRLVRMRKAQRFGKDD